MATRFTVEVRGDNEQLFKRFIEEGTGKVKSPGGLYSTYYFADPIAERGQNLWYDEIVSGRSLTILEGECKYAPPCCIFDFAEQHPDLNIIMDCVTDYCNHERHCMFQGNYKLRSVASENVRTGQMEYHILDGKKITELPDWFTGREITKEDDNVDEFAARRDVVREKYRKLGLAEQFIQQVEQEVDSEFAAGIESEVNS